MNRPLLALTLLLASLLPSITALSCLDRSNNEVPWFTFIKYPGSLTSSSMRYAYLDSNLDDTYQIIYGSQIDTEGEALHNVFTAINALSKKEKNLLLFNDEPPESLIPEGYTGSSGAHAKGIVAFDNTTKTGVYIIHSIPLFPELSETDHIEEAIPSTGLTYGQNGYCISIDEEILSSLVANLPAEDPIVYLATGLFESFAATAAAAAANPETASTMAQFKLLNGEEQWFFTKSPSDSSFLFDDIIGPYFKTNLAVESWGRPYQASSCPPDSTYSTLNIDVIAFNTDDTWKHTKDHSKWAITVDDKVKLACMCDMNRMTSQAKRGGSCMCTKNDNLFKALSAIVVSTDVCSTSSSSSSEHKLFDMFGYVDVNGM